jgi:hypothetical protein
MKDPYLPPPPSLRPYSPPHFVPNPTPPPSPGLRSTLPPAGGGGGGWMQFAVLARLWHMETGHYL